MNKIECNSGDSGVLFLTIRHLATPQGTAQYYSLEEKTETLSA